jgi:hypothetical protein
VKWELIGTYTWLRAGVSSSSPRFTMKVAPYLSLLTFAVAVSAAAVGRRQASSHKFNIVHKDMPADALPKPPFNQDPVVLSQKAIDYLNALPEPKIASCLPYTGDPNSLQPACQWTLYDTSIWMDEYIATLLTKYGKTSTNDLDYYWLRYLWNDYSQTGRQWRCDWSVSCNNQPIMPATNASIDYINAYFVLQSFNHWDQYMRVHTHVIEHSRLAFVELHGSSNEGLAGTYNNFKSDDNKRPGNDNYQPYDPTTLLRTIRFVLSFVPLPGRYNGALPGVNFERGFIPTPEAPEPLPNYGLEEVTSSFNEMLGGWADGFKRTYMTALNYQDFLMPLLRKGAFLEEIEKQTVEEWEEIRVFPSPYRC